MSNNLLITEEQAQINNRSFRRYMAKGGVTLPDTLARDVNARDAHGFRAKIRDAMSEITNRSDREGRQMSDTEMVIYTEGAEFISGLSTAIDLEATTQRMVGAATGSWVDAASGRPLTVLNSTDKLADSARDDSRLGGINGINFGDIVRGLAGRATPDVRNALSEGTDSAGGYTVPSFLIPQLIDKMRALQTCVKLGGRTLMLDGMRTTIARLDADPVAAWRNEGAAIATSDAAFSAVVLQPRSLAVLVILSQELLEDSVNLSEGLARAFAGSFAVELDRVALFGSGTAPEPRGIFNTAGVNIFSMGVNGSALTNFDPLVDGWQTLADANSPGPTGAILAPRSLAKIGKLKDTQNQPLRKPPMIEAMPLLSSTSVPITQTQGSSSVASSIIVGDFTQLLFGIRTDLRIQLLRELYAGTGQFAFVCHLRADIAVEHPQAFCKIIGVL